MADTTKTIHCPACNKEMIKIFDPVLNINIDVCVNGCGGIYFDNQEYEIFRDHPENIESTLEFIMTDKPQKVDENEFRICPVCGGTMIKSYLNGFNKVQVDKCIDCGGVFLDYGELSMLRISN